MRLLYLNQRNPAVDSFLENLSAHEQQLALEVACPSLPRPVSSAFRATEVMRKSGILESSRHYGFKLPFVGSCFLLEHNVLYTLSGDTPGGFSRVYFRTSDRPTLYLEQFDCPAEDLRTLEALLSRESPSLLLFFGTPGTGKTEFARALAHHRNLEPVIVNFEAAHTPQAQFSTLAVSSRFHDPRRQLLIVDEADTLLNTGMSTHDADGVDKGILNTFLDEFPGHAVFIVNRLSAVEDSVKRRFHFSRAFLPLTPEGRHRVWNRLSSDLPALPQSSIDALAVHYEANPAQIRNCLEIALGLQISGHSEQEVFASVQGVLAASQNLIQGNLPPPLRRTETEYSDRWLNLDTDPAALLSQLCRWKVEFKQGGAGIGALFSGPPGTGKSLLARQLARRLSLTLTVKRASDLLSPYVGETEANIRRAFQTAEGGVLVIDEADSFFLDRSLSERSWERSLTNEMLQGLESFRGLFIATTNSLGEFDQASFRRLPFQVEFRPLRPEQRGALLREFFPTVEWNEVELREASLLASLTVGDVAAVERRVKFSENLSPSGILGEVQKLVRGRLVNQRITAFSG